MSGNLPNLAATWLAIREQRGETRAAALRWLNTRLHRRYTSSRLNEWLRGDLAPDRPARLLMMREALADVFGAQYALDLPPDAWDDLSEALT